MKYVLAKPLPFAEVGTEVLVEDHGYGDAIFIRATNSPDGAGNWKNYLGRKHKCIKEGWIKKVEPREIWVLTHTNGNEYVCDSLKEAQLLRWSLESDNVIKKFIEVTE